ncbi:MAG: hypothetical protein CL484_04180 [Acidobacteria bacterium]|jgi:hypothetical protein|uniref:DUF6927 domain-containing protein n=1 Tax=Halomonas sp. PA16-9 TaxID=2576841 RepID=UPI000C991F25|nr:hypothetical protein [Acidobacteriota bacterium]QGQ72638.1 hypothetical protein FDY98_25885 [Halomonas sp. PA16-9]|tara:strand:+ start:1513 stop:2103 length:591 start_codon:yes stop_codon:yes gene_type:complete
MGTLCIPMPADKKAYLDDNYSSADGSHIVLKSTFVGSTYYAAVRITKRGDSDDEPPVIFTLGAVVKTSSMQGEFCYKSMDESMGPNESQCPIGILLLLTPTEELIRMGIFSEMSGGWAQAWRDRCLQHAEAKKKRPRLKPGDRIKLPYTVRFVGGLEADTFTKVELPRRRNVFRPEGSASYVRLTPQHLNDAELLA